MKKNLFIGLVAMLAVGLILAAFGCSSISSAPDQNEWLLQATVAGRLDGVQYALERGGANINYQNNYYSRNTALMLASREGHFNIVQYLVKSGADVNLRNTNNDTALIWALYRGHITIARYLIDNGININARNDQGKSALNYAYEKGEMDIYNYLIARGAVQFEPNQVAQQPAAPQTDVYVQPSAPAQSPAPSTPSPAQRIQEALRSPLESGTYALAGTQARISLTAIAKSGIFSFTNLQGRTSMGNYQIDGDRMTMQVDGYTYVYTITSSTSFSGNGETWVRTGY